MGGESRTGDCATAAVRRRGTSASVGESAPEEDESTATCKSEGTLTKVGGLVAAPAPRAALPGGGREDDAMSAVSGTSQKNQKD